MVARWRDNSWEVEVEAVCWELLTDRSEPWEHRSHEERRQLFEKLREENVSQAAILASQLSWLPD